MEEIVYSEMLVPSIKLPLNLEAAAYYETRVAIYQTILKVGESDFCETLLQTEH